MGGWGNEEGFSGYTVLYGLINHTFWYVWEEANWST